MEALQVHHIQPRGQLGDDAAENLVALCAECHRGIHLRISVHAKSTPRAR
jgi:predicted HNH restriction endonuclease